MGYNFVLSKYEIEKKKVLTGRWSTIQPPSTKRSTLKILSRVFLKKKIDTCQFRREQLQ